MKKSIAIILLSVGIFLLGEGIFIIIYKSNSSLDNEMNINEEKEPNINEDNVIKYTNVKHLENNEALDKLEAKIKKEKVVEEKRIIDNSKTEELITNNVFSRNLIYDKEAHRLTFFKDDVLMGTYTCPTNIDGNDYCYFVNDYLIRNDYNLEEKVEIGQELTDVIVDRYVFLTNSPYSNYFSTNKEHPYVLYDLIESKELGKFTAVKADRQENLDYSKLYDKTDNFRFMLRDENKKWGLVVFNSDGIEEILDYEFDYIGHYSDYYMLVKDNLYYVYNPTTTQIVGPFYNEITQISNNFIVTNEGEYRNNNEKNYRIYTNDGKK